MARTSTILGLAGVLLALGTGEASATPMGWWDSQWLNRIDVTLTEPGVADRNEEYVDLVIDFPPERFTDLSAEVRVIDEMGVELPSLVHSQFVNQAHVLLNLSMPMDTTQTIHVYFGNAAAVAPSYVFPEVPAIFYVNDPAFLGAHEVNLETNYEGLSLYGQISLAVDIANGNTDYDPAVARTLRVAFVSGSCSVCTALSMTTIYQDVSIWGVSNGSCLEINLFGLTDGNDPTDVQVPVLTDYITQDFMSGQVLSYACGQAATPNGGGVLELVSGASPSLGCMLRFEDGQVLPNFQTLEYRTLFSGLIAPFDADATTIHTRAAEFLLQDNRVGVVLGSFEDIDVDGDAVADRDDNCPEDANADQADADMDAIGDLCDACPDDPDNDVDGDMICGEVDNCPEVDNPDQADEDDDGVGDACEASDETTGGSTGGAESTGAADSTAGAGGTTGPSIGTSTGASAESSGSGDSTVGSDDEGGGCGCRSDRRPPGAPAVLLLLLAARRRRSVRA